MRKRDDIKTRVRLREVQQGCDELNKNLKNKGFKFRPGDYGAWIEITVKAYQVERFMNERIKTTQRAEEQQMKQSKKMPKVDLMKPLEVQDIDLIDEKDEDMIDIDENDSVSLFKRNLQNRSNNHNNSNQEILKPVIEIKQSENMTKVNSDPFKNLRSNRGKSNESNKKMDSPKSSQLLSQPDSQPKFSSMMKPQNQSPNKKEKVVEKSELINRGPLKPQVIDESYFIERSNKILRTPTKSTIQESVVPQLGMSAKQKRFYERLQEFKKKKEQTPGKIPGQEDEDDSHINRGLDVHYDSVVPKFEVVYNPDKSMNLMVEDPFK